MQPCEESWFFVTQPPGDLNEAEGQAACPEATEPGHSRVGVQLTVSSQAAREALPLLPVFPLFSAMLEDLGSRIASHSREWALSSRRTPGWGLGHPRWQSDSRCTMVSICFLVLEFFL